MPYSVELRFDEALTSQIVEIWRTLAAINVCPMPPGQAAPHLSLAVYDDEHGIDPVRIAEKVNRLTRDRERLPVRFSSVGVFPGEERVLFLAPVTSRPLLNLHAAWHAPAADLAGSCWSYYLPGNWVPHCTLGAAVPTSGLATAIEHLRERWTSLAGTLQSVALIRAQPVEVLYQRPLSG